MSIPPTRWLARLLGRRGASLVVLGLAFVFVGLGVMLNHEPPDYDRFLIHTFMPTPLRAALWLIPGLLALLAAAKRGTGADTFGFAALVVPVIVRTVSYVWSSVMYLAGESDWPYAWSNALVWVGCLALILIIAGWPEVPEPPKPRKRRKRRRGASL